MGKLWYNCFIPSHPCRPYLVGNVLNFAISGKSDIFSELSKFQSSSQITDISKVNYLIPENLLSRYQ